MCGRTTPSADWSHRHDAFDERGGSQSFGLDSEAVLWINRSPTYLKDYLRAHGVPDAFEGWVNTGFINGVSSNGRILVGYGAGPTDFQGYIVILGANP